MSRSFPIVLWAAFLISGPAAAQSESSGQSLHDQYCVACHNQLTGGHPEQLYTRPNRRVTSAEGLARQVRRCEQNLELRLFDDDLQALTDYLNEQYYHFAD